MVGVIAGVVIAGLLLVGALVMWLLGRRAPPDQYLDIESRERRQMLFPHEDDPHDSHSR